MQPKCDFFCARQRIKLLVLAFMLMVPGVILQAQASGRDSEKKRVLVLTDIENELDDGQSLGEPNVLAQALWKVRETLSAEKLKKFVNNNWLDKHVCKKRTLGFLLAAL